MLYRASKNYKSYEFKAEPHFIRRTLEKVATIATYCHLRPPDTIAFPT